MQCLLPPCLENDLTRATQVVYQHVEFAIVVSFPGHSARKTLVRRCNELRDNREVEHCK